MRGTPARKSDAKQSPWSGRPSLAPKAKKDDELSSPEPGARRSALWRMDMLRPKALADHASGLLRRLEDPDAEVREVAQTLYGKHIADSVKGDGLTKAVDDAFKLQRNAQWEDSRKESALLERRPRLMKIHQERMATAQQQQPFGSQMPPPSGRELQQQQQQQAQAQAGAAPHAAESQAPSEDWHTLEDKCRWDVGIVTSMPVFTATMPSAMLAPTNDVTRRKQGGACLICLSRDRARAYPCGHRCVCTICTMPARCPVCHMKNVQRVPAEVDELGGDAPPQAGARSPRRLTSFSGQPTPSWSRPSSAAVNPINPATDSRAVQRQPVSSGRMSMAKGTK